MATIPTTSAQCHCYFSFTKRFSLIFFIIRIFRIFCKVKNRDPAEDLFSLLVIRRKSIC